MSTYTQLLYQIVFSTKNRQPVLTKKNRKELYKYIWGILKNKQCHLYQINGVENHLHIITHIHPTVAISTLVKDIKLASSKFIKQNQLFTDFQGWQSGYGAFTYSIKAKDQLIEYVKNQEEHHKHCTFLEEYKALLSYHGISFDDRYFP
ncbi:MAG: IS200/IS605 family transposase [Gracilimonas sp.]|uniref:IS200/IS605 family transposase n=1 Tax=Gracilimonas TaxID=649462 RepID=UPI001AFFF3AC|nr:IS200/IS605 family transposase [Gracilimonas sp.]MBO6586537.1 IS200/IS605 family transposase [Gracilimonas sp.]MBO6615194.1 IS200/IS605 family transposase [Gracilimonas sp.]